MFKIFDFSRFDKEQLFLLSVIVFLPLIQYGYSYFISLQCLLFVFLLLLCKPIKFDFYVFAPLILGTASVFWAVLFLDVDINYLREIRLFVGCSLLFAIFKSYKVKRSEEFARIVIAAMLFFLVITSLQLYLSKIGYYYYAPSSWFVNKSDWSLADVWVADALEKGYEIAGLRAPAFFSEPSYLGGISLFLHLLGLQFVEGKNKWIVTLLAILISAVAGSFYGIATNCILALAFFSRGIFDLVIVLLITIVFIVLNILFNDSVADRVSLIISGHDESTYVRLIDPIVLIWHVLTNHPFGIPQSSIVSYFQGIGMIGFYDDPPIQNGFFNVFLQFGWGGGLLLFFFWRAVKDWFALVFIFLMMLQNGASFDFDKLLYYSIAIAVINGYKEKSHG